MKPTYDIFISYRRDEGKDIARMLKESLERKGYHVFLDMDELQDGVFDQRILDAIQSAPIFMILLTAHALDRCVNEQDWVRQEIEYALFSNKHIIPINPDKQFVGFSETVPNNIKNGLSRHQYSAIDTGQLYQESVEKLIKERVKPLLKKEWWKWLIVAMGIIAILLGGHFGYTDCHRRHLIAYYTEMGDKYDSVLIFTHEYYSAVDSAFYYYHLGAIAGDPYCQCRVSDLYASNTSANQNNDSALYWAQESYDNGYYKAPASLAYFYFNGIGVQKDRFKAIQLYKEGLEKGDDDVLFMLGTIYRKGEDVPRDFVLGSYYYVQAAQKGDGLSKLFLGKLQTWIFNPQVDSVTEPLVTIKAISWSTDDTLRLYCEWHNKHYGWMQIDHKAFVENARTGMRYEVSDVVNCTFSPDTTPVAFGKKHYFALVFAGVPDSIDVLNFCETDTSDWKFFGIHIEEKIKL